MKVIYLTEEIVPDEIYDAFSILFIYSFLYFDVFNFYKLSRR